MAECILVGTLRVPSFANDGTGSVPATLLFLHVVFRQRQLEARPQVRRGGLGCRRLRMLGLGPLLDRRLADPLAEDGGVVPAEAQFGVAGKSAQRPQGLAPPLVVEQEDVALFAFDQRQHIDVLRHEASPGSVRHPAAVAPPEAGRLLPYRSYRRMGQRHSTCVSPAPPLAANVSVR